jgi:hypothetical protein
MMNFTQYRARYEAELTRLKEAFAQLPMAEKSRRVLGRDNPLLYSPHAVGSRLSASGLSQQALSRDLERQTAQFEQIAYQTLVRAPLRRLPLPDAQWIFLDFTGQAGGWRFRRAHAIEKFRTAIAGKPPESACRFLSGGVVTSDLLNRLMLDEFSRPDASFQTAAKQLNCRFQLWVARSRTDIPRGACVRID